MKERKAEIIINLIFAVLSFIAGIIYTIALTPNIFNLIAGIGLSTMSVLWVLNAMETYIEARKADKEWEDFVNSALSDEVSISSKSPVLKKKRRKKNARRKIN